MYYILIAFTLALANIALAQDSVIWPFEVRYTVSHLTLPRAVVKCSGAFVAPTWILTPAHCLEDAQYLLISTALGEGGLVEANNDTINIHPLYNAKTRKNDIALINVAGIIPANSPLIRTVKLARSRLYKNSTVIVNPFLKLSNWHSNSIYNIVPAKSCGCTPCKQFCVKASAVPCVEQLSSLSVNVSQNETLLVGLHAYDTKDRCNNGGLIVHTLLYKLIPWIEAKIIAENCS